MIRGIRLAAVFFFCLLCWLVFVPSCDSRIFGSTGKTTYDLRIGEFRGKVTLTHAPSGEPSGPTFQIRWTDGRESRPLTQAEFIEVFGTDVTDAITRGEQNLFFRLFKISSWDKLLWVAAGLAGQGAFFLRMLVQWIVSEKERRSIVPPIFWWFSLLGAVLLTTYFAWRQDIVGILGQSPGLIVYTRNLRLISKHANGNGKNSASSPV